jgi:hypothetical protein
VVFDVESEGAFQELDGKIVLADRVKDEAYVAVDQGHLRVVLADHDEGKVASTVQKFECSAKKNISKLDTD